MKDTLLKIEAVLNKALHPDGFETTTYWMIGVWLITMPEPLPKWRKNLAFSTVAYIYHGKCKTSNFRLNLHRKHYIETFYVSVPLSIHNIENLTSKMNKLWRLQVLKLPSLFITISFDVITSDLPQIRCNVQPPNNTSKKIRRIVFSVISVHEAIEYQNPSNTSSPRINLNSF